MFNLTHPLRNIENFGAHEWSRDQTEEGNFSHLSRSRVREGNVGVTSNDHFSNFITRYRPSRPGRCLAAGGGGGRGVAARRGEAAVPYIIDITRRR